MRRLPTIILIGAAAMTATAAPLRVACIGDSITYGDQIANRDRDAYPAVLQRLSGGRFVTGNFGVNGATALPVLFREWGSTAAARDALAFEPDLAVVMLGINDLAFPERYSEYPAALAGVIRRFQALPSSPRLFVCTLTPIAPPDQQAEVNHTIQTVFNPAIRAVAAETGASVIDISAAFPNRLDLLPDSVHPSAEGAEIIARTVLEALEAATAPPPAIRPAPAAGPVDISIRNEACAARHRAETWLETHPPAADLPDPAARWADAPPQTPDDLGPLLQLLDGGEPEPDGNLYLDFAALAIALDRIGHETVFLPDGKPVAWREALLHQLVQRQRIDPRGGGFWEAPGVPTETATPLALRALAAALGE